MRTTILLLALAAGAAHAGPSIFGIELAAPLAVRECPSKYGVVKESPCYRRDNKTGPLLNETIEVVFPSELKPDLTPLSHVAVHAVDGAAERISFWTHGLSSQDRVYAALVAKFGSPGSVERRAATTRYGAVFDALEASWALPDGTTVEMAGVFDSTTRGLAVIETPKGKAATGATVGRAGVPL